MMRPRVIHRLPGRMRIHIPALKKVTPEFAKITKSLLKGFKLPENFKSADVNFF
jgi:hypothetical protein